MWGYIDCRYGLLIHQHIVGMVDVVVQVEGMLDAHEEWRLAGNAEWMDGLLFPSEEGAA